jgi:hypothetical protein
VKWLLLVMLLPGCMTTNALEAEKAYYAMQTAAIYQQRSAAAQPLFEMASHDSSKPIVLENVAYIRVFQPVTESAQVQPAQYRQTDYMAPWAGLLNNALGMAIPFWGAYKMIGAATKSAGDAYSVHNNGDGNSMSFQRDTFVSNPTVGNDLNFQSDFTQPAQAPVIVNPVVVRPEVVDPVIVDPIVIDR